MKTYAIPVSYPGTAPYELHFRRDGDTLYVRRSWPGAPEKEVHDLKGVPDPKGSDAVLVEINGDLAHGVPIYALMGRDDYEVVKGMRG